MKKVLIIFLATCWLISVLSWKTPGGFNVPPGWPAPLVDFTGQPLDKNKIQLGRMLFYDPLLSRDSSVSCASCHSPFSAFAHTDHALSHGIGDSVGHRNAPALMNLAWQPQFMWDGAFTDLEKQILFPISHPGEMGEDTLRLRIKLQNIQVYRKKFAAAYGDSTITTARVTGAIREFLLTLVSSESKYDSIQRKQAVFTEQEEKGYALFKARCSSCHTEPLFSNYGFENNGLAPDTFLRDPGRAGISKRSADSLRFKVPSLRNIAYTYPYMHDGRFRNLRQVLDHYSGDLHISPTLAEVLQKNPILDTNQKTDLIAFLLTLTDRKFLFNPAHGYPAKTNTDTIKP